MKDGWQMAALYGAMFGLLSLASAAGYYFYKKDQAEKSSWAVKTGEGVSYQIYRKEGIRSVEIYVNGQLKYSKDFNAPIGNSTKRPIRCLKVTCGNSKMNLSLEDEVILKVRDHGKSFSNPNDDNISELVAEAKK